MLGGGREIYNNLDSAKRKSIWKNKHDDHKNMTAERFTSITYIQQG